MKKSFLIFSIVYVVWVAFIFSYNLWKNRQLNEMLYVHNNILVVKEQLSEINEEIEDFFYYLEKEEKSLDTFNKLQPQFFNKIDNILVSFDYNTTKYGCLKCHTNSDPLIKKIFNEKEDIAKSFNNFKEVLAAKGLTREANKNLIVSKKDLINKINLFKSSFHSMENNIHDNMIRKFVKHQRLEVLIGLISLISILYLIYLIYKKILKDLMLLKKIVKKVEDGTDSIDINLNSFNSNDFKYISETILDSFKRLKSIENQLKSQIDEIESMNEELQSSNQQLEMVTAELEEIKNNLEKKVQEKTKELEEAYKELERSEAIKSSFLQSISHEFKTPLTPLFGYLKLMKNKELGDLTPLQEQSLNIMLTCAEKIYNTIDDLILLTKLDVDKESFLFKDIDLNQIVRTVSSRVEKEIEEKRLKIVLDIPDIPMIIKGEQLILIQMILHLLRNSIKYTQEGGKITISLSLEDGLAVLRVSDTGQGIPDRVLQEINEYFNSKTKLLTKKGDTITVGLNILKKVSLLHNCKVVYKSKKNEGTTVELYFQLKS